MTETPSKLPLRLLTGLGLGTLLCIAALGWVFFVAPADENLGIVQKIFYFHVGSAFGMLLCLCAASASALIDLMAPNETIDAAGQACTEVGMIFALGVLTSGPLWARKSWGTWWTWEPRLTPSLC
jgi:heme exporter protein C